MKEYYFSLSIPLGLLLAILITFIILLAIWNIFHKEHTILRNFPVIGYIRYFAESLGVYLRQYLYARGREELPFNRTERTWVYEASKNTDTTMGFGTTRDRRPLNTIYFIDSPFPVLKRDVVKAHSVTIGPHCRIPYTTNSLINISAMSHGAISKNAILALSHGAEKAGCWLNTGEGGLSPYHLDGRCDLIAQIGTAKYGYHDEKGNLSDEKLKEAAAHQVKTFEIKLSQGAKPGKGGLLTAIKLTKEIAKIRGIKPYEDSVSPNRFPEISNSFELLNLIHHSKRSNR